MGIGDRSDPTTDYFDTLKAMCTKYEEKLRSTGGTVATLLLEVVALCDAAILAGRLRTDMQPVIDKCVTILTEYGKLPANVRTTFEAQKYT